MSMRRLVVEFTKMTGAGNDFIVIDNRFYHFSGAELADIARRHCPRRTGIGADGVLAMEEAEGVDFRMRYLNADGSVGSMCGNGARCLARYARAAGMTAEPLVFLTDAGTYRASVPENSTADVRLYLPPHADYGTRSLDAGVALPDVAHYVWTGTEHVVVFVDRANEAPVAVEGPRLRRDPGLSTHGANVDFVEVAGPDHLRVRTYEKGVEEETLACGTGATAAAVTACLTGRVLPGRIRVDMPGGRLHVGILGDARRPDEFFLEGPADLVFRGSFEH